MATKKSAIPAPKSTTRKRDPHSTAASTAVDAQLERYRSMRDFKTTAEPSGGEVMLASGMRLGKLNQNQFGYEDERVLDVVMRGHTELWAAMKERDRIYADPNATDDDYMKAAELEGVFAEYGGYDAEARAGSILTDAGIHESRHNGPMREVPFRDEELLEYASCSPWRVTC